MRSVAVLGATGSIGTQALDVIGRAGGEFELVGMSAGRAHDALVVPQFVTCPACGEPTQRHRACAHCGQYRGRQVVEVGEE